MAIITKTKTKTVLCPYCGNVAAVGVSLDDHACYICSDCAARRNRRLDSQAAERCAFEREMGWAHK